MKLPGTTTFGLTATILFSAFSFAAAETPAPVTPPERPDLVEIINEFREAQQNLVEERRELAESLRDASVEERRQAIEEYQEANAERIALHRALGETIRDLMTNNRPQVERPDRPERPETAQVEDRPVIRDEVQELVAEFRATRDALLQQRLALLESLRDATDAERAQALADLREKNSEIAASQREMADEIREAVQDLREERRND